MSLRQQAKILGIAPSYLSMMVNGKRPWKPEIRERYDQLVNSGFMPEQGQSVNTFVNTPKIATQLRGGRDSFSTPTHSVMVGGNGFEPMTSAMSTQRSKPLS